MLKIASVEQEMSDGSIAFNVVVTDEDGSGLTIGAINEEAADRLAEAITAALNGPDVAWVVAQ